MSHLYQQVHARHSDTTDSIIVVNESESKVKLRVIIPYAPVLSLLLTVHDVT